MKIVTFLKTVAVAAITSALTGACADIGFGVDVDDGLDDGSIYVPNYGPVISTNPWWSYGTGWNTGWGGQPAPPVVGNGPGSVISPRPPRPIRPIQPINPGGAFHPNGIPAASERPGNMGRY